MAIQITVENFEEEVLKSDIPVLVDFWAPWCGPCKALLPVVEEISQKAEGFKVVKINTDENQSLAMKYHILTIPTLLVFKNGQVINRSVGLISEEEIYSLLND